ncbi:hypothetical protein EDD16DRAFT_1825970 [Pisolithus croceorrhizus]|nr:hypothetical protein EV401DRAFT_1856397 [Pisolithus croceorrhizus]KAI6126186.1 hypothetical protein EDD16DRAFT_1825970 [Pisolithus croceorrhizus]
MSVSEYDSDCSYGSLTWFSSQNPPSDFTNRHTSPAPVDHVKDVQEWQRKTLPLELVEHIFDLFFLNNKAFKNIRPFAMASTQFRTVALRRYMSTLRIHSKEQLISYTLMHYSIASRSSPHAYSGFDWVKWDGSRVQGNILNRILSKPTFSVLASRLTSLKMTSLWRIDVDLLGAVAKTFPALTDLHLSCSENLDTSCCWLCYEESSIAVIHSPIPDHYANVKTLTNAFAEALLPLIRLVHLHLGIFLSDEDMVDAHVDHYDSPQEYERALFAYTAEKKAEKPVTTLSQSERSNGESEENISCKTDEGEDDLEHRYDGELLPFPHGPDECPLCAILVSASKVRTRELEASLAMARKLRSIEMISWSSFFPPKQCTTEHASVGDQSGTATTYVLRVDGRVRVRRRPWD